MVKGSSDDVGLQVLRAIRRIVRGVSRYSRRVGKESGLTVPQLLCLRTLSAEAAGVTVGQVSEAVQLSKSTTSVLVDGLVKRGLISRERSLTDRRRVELRLTDAGQERLADLPAPLETRFVERLGALSAVDQVRLVAALEQVVDLMGADDLDASPVLVPGSDLLRGP